MANNAEPALILSRVCARFADEREAGAYVLRDISLAVERGSFVSVAGPSGAGKSTLMRVVLGLMRPASGHIVRRYERAAMVFQNYALFPWLSALENAAYGLKMAGVGKREREAIARENLAEVGLAHLESRYPIALSGGQRQRVGLARALAVNPDLLVMDEPFSNLDTITAEALKADLVKIWRQYGMTILMINHLIPDAVELSDQVVVMAAKPGRIKEVIDIDLVRPRDPRSPHFFREVDRLTEAIRAVSQ
ncbi:MAG: ABC transporter ATP-binding protein [Patescibacteria group bacterium]|nr:ABC transporter ATP-binding protein [Patescibacteria group bacterium]MDE1944465.1 ABC transporter ATP-binding protein [Patescibacteria group bacterium]MDE1945290.1 ABC transporter ATP-binding protein [Patescibacteria group bacterium]MDE2057867.1 ABC transporter ATP-binding protein [Patescibacteria group bacterium]